MHVCSIADYHDQSLHNAIVQFVGIETLPLPSKILMSSKFNTLNNKFLSFILIFIVITTEPAWWKVNTIVIPIIMSHWKDVALISLQYNPSMVERLDKQYTSDGKMCCTRLFDDWLNTENGVSPKTWQTLLTQLNEVEGLADKVKEIIKRLAIGGTYAL